MNQINIAIATDCTLAYEGLKKILSGDTALNILDRASSFSELLHNAETKPSIVLICPNTINRMIMKSDKFKHLFENHPDIKIIVFNVDPEEEDEMLRLFKAGLMGIIYKNDLPSVFPKAIRAVHSDEIWIKRKTIFNLVKYGTKKIAVNPNQKKTHKLLTLRETEILDLIAEGCKNRTIAERLHISEHTVKYHIQNIFRKLNIKNRVEAVIFKSMQSID